MFFRAIAEQAFLTSVQGSKIAGNKNKVVIKEW